MAKKAAITVCFLLLKSALALTCNTASATLCDVPIELTRMFRGAIAGEGSSGGCVSFNISPPLASEISSMNIISAPVLDHKNHDLLEVLGKWCMHGEFSLALDLATCFVVELFNNVIVPCICFSHIELDKQREQRLCCLSPTL